MAHPAASDGYAIEQHDPEDRGYGDAGSASAAGSAPSSPKEWRLPVETFAKKKVDEVELKKLDSKVGKFYKKQNELVDAFINVDRIHETRGLMEDHNTDDPLSTGRLGGPRPPVEEEPRKVKMAVNLSLGVNVCLFILKLFVAISSGSLSVIASALDSFLDLLSGTIVFITNRLKNRKDPYNYPIGKSRHEPIGVVIFASCMMTATVQLISQALQTLITQESDISIKTPTLVVLSITIATKLALFLFCRTIRDRSPSVDALRRDHRNDVVSNTFGVGTALIGYYLAWYADAIGAIVIGTYIIINWARVTYAQVKVLSGSSASPAFLSQVTYLAWNHHEKIKEIDTVRAFHLGQDYVVEVDIVLPPEISLREAHDIGEELQIKLEKLPEVERAFVHLDYESQHKPEHAVKH